MKFLITSGGTKVPIDPVRDITNMSRGTFGSKIAVEALRQRHAVHYFAGEDSVGPFEFKVDLHQRRQKLWSVDPEIERLTNLQVFCNWAHKEKLYSETRYRNYDDYASLLERDIAEQKPDVIVLAAAVSDYITDSSQTKVRSGKDLTIQLKPAEKIISKVRAWAPEAILIGFKLLVDVSSEDLIEAALASIETNDCDLVVANDLMSLKRGNHELYIVSKESSYAYGKVQHVTKEQATSVVERAESIHVFREKRPNGN